MYCMYRMFLSITDVVIHSHTITLHTTDCIYDINLSSSGSHRCDGTSDSLAPSDCCVWYVRRRRSEGHASIQCIQTLRKKRKSFLSHLCTCFRVIRQLALERGVRCLLLQRLRLHTGMQFDWSPGCSCCALIISIPGWRASWDRPMW